jgi:hypothetical protein
MEHFLTKKQDAATITDDPRQETALDLDVDGLPRGAKQLRDIVDREEKARVIDAADVLFPGVA